MKYDENTASVILSVRELCEMTLCSGDLEFGGRRFPERAQLGAQIHRNLQAERNGKYQPEVVLTNTCRVEDICFCVSGRADGVEEDEDGFIVEEIKTMRSGTFCAPIPEIYKAQLWIYGYFLCASRNLPGVHLRMVRVNIDSDKIKETTEYVSTENLRTYYISLLAKICRFAKLLVTHTIEDCPRMKNLPFPYAEMRLGQEDMIRAVWRNIKKQKRLFVQAPTGIGKTMSTLYPAVRARGETLCDRIFYLTAKASTRREALEAAKNLQRLGARLRTVVLTAREQICLHPMRMQYSGEGENFSSHCNSVECEYAMGYYDHFGEAIWELLTTGCCFTRQNIQAIAEKYKVCPYELSLDLSEYCDLIIADYNYVFDPAVYLRRYFGPVSIEGKNVFLIDEAHNLADRARDMYSAILSCRNFEKVYAKVDRRDTQMNDALETVIRGMRGQKKLCRDTMEVDEQGQEIGFALSKNPLTAFNEKMSWFVDQCDDWMKVHREEEIAPRILSLSMAVREYLRILEEYDEHFVTCVEVASGDIIIKILCLDPSSVLNVRLNRAIASVLFSATLTPLSYFSDVLGGGESAECMALPSPYEKERFGLFVLGNVSTRFSQREESYRHIASCIAATVKAKKGNYIVYFPSYAYLEAVYKQFRIFYPNVKTILQKKGMRASEKETFLDAFLADENILRVGFCVLGGSFAEGVDLPGSRLIGSIIVGVGLPGLSNERNVLSEYYQNKCEMGYQYSYLYPGMNHVLQAAGRVIRREEDRGVVVLVDDRYASPEYRNMFPPHWSHVKYAEDVKELAELTKDFWIAVDGVQGE